MKRYFKKVKTMYYVTSNLDLYGEKKGNILYCITKAVASKFLLRGSDDVNSNVFPHSTNTKCNIIIF